MAFKMKGFHMPGIAGVKAEVDKINKLSGKTQKVMKVKPKDEFSTIASRKKIYDSRYVAQGADQEDVDSEKAYEESQKTPLPMKGRKFYGDRSMKDMRQDIRTERKSLKDEGGTRGEVKAFNAHQTLRKKQIRADELDSRGRTKRADNKRSNALDKFDKKRSNALGKIEAKRIKENKKAIDSFGTKK
jgi:hypothetical protein